MCIPITDLPAWTNSFWNFSNIRMQVTINEKKRKRDNWTRKKEEKILFLYFCTQKVKKKRGKSKPKKRKSAENTKSHMHAISQKRYNLLK